MQHIMQATKLVELLDEAQKVCKEQIEDRHQKKVQAAKDRKEPEPEPLTDEELETTSAIMGYGAVKYADLKNNRKTNYKQASAPIAPVAVSVPGMTCKVCMQGALCS